MSFHDHEPTIPICSHRQTLFRGCRYTTQLHPRRHHWPPHSNPKRPTFQRGSPPPAPTPDSPPGCSSPTSGTFCDCPLTFISDAEPTTSPACPTGYVSLECIHFAQPPLHHCPTQALASLAWTTSLFHRLVLLPISFLAAAKVAFRNTDLVLFLWLTYLKAFSLF